MFKSTLLLLILSMASFSAFGKTKFDNNFEIYLDEYQGEVYVNSYFYISHPTKDKSYTIEDHSRKGRVSLEGTKLFLNLDDSKVFLGSLSSESVAKGQERRKVKSITKLKVKVVKDKIKRKFRFFGCSGIGCWFKPTIDKTRHLTLEVTTPLDTQFCYQTHPKRGITKIRSGKCK